MSSRWHADEDLLRRYVRGDAGPLMGASIEQHLTHCADCRDRIAMHVAAQPLELVWDRIREHALAPSPGPFERLLRRLGVPEPDALVVAVAPSLRASWLFGLCVVLGFVGLATKYGGGRGLALFLLVAPLVPVAGVAFAYGPDVDPSYEVGAAAPYSAVRLLLLRTAGVLASCLPLALTTALVIPNLSWTAVSWLLPASALTAVLLAAATWTRRALVGAGLGLGWAGAVGAASLSRDPTAVLAPTLLLVYAAVGVAAMLLLRLRLRHLTLPWGLS